MDLTEDFTIMREIVIGSLKAYRNYMPPEDRTELARMLEWDRITAQRAWWREQLLAFHGMTHVERLWLRQENAFWTRFAMLVWGVTVSDRTPKLIKRHRDWRRWYDSDTVDYGMPEKLEQQWQDGTITRAGYEALRGYYLMSLNQRNMEIESDECSWCFRELPEGRHLCPHCGCWN